MPRLVIGLVFCLLGVADLLVSAAFGDAIDAARVRLAAYHAADPQPAERLLHIVCWRPSDRDFAASACPCSEKPASTQAGRR